MVAIAAVRGEVHRQRRRFAMSANAAVGAAVTHRYLDDNFTHWNDDDRQSELTGDWMIPFPESHVCQKPWYNAAGNPDGRMHFLPEPITE